MEATPLVVGYQTTLVGDMRDDFNHGFLMTPDMSHIRSIEKRLDDIEDLLDRILGMIERM